MLALSYWMLLGPFLKFTCSRIRGPVPVPVSVPVPVPVFPYCATMVEGDEQSSLWVIKPKSNAAPRVCTSHDEEA